MKQVSIKPGGAPRPLTCAVRIGCLEVASSDSKIQLIWTCMESKNILLSTPPQFNNILCSNFEMMSPEDPLLVSRPIASCDSVHRSARSRVFSHPVANHSLSVVLPLRREAFPFCRFPLLWPSLGSFFGCFFGRPLVTPRGVVWRRCNRPRVRPPAADLVIKLWVLCILLTTLPC